jgi:hypothetical protein
VHAVSLKIKALRKCEGFLLSEIKILRSDSDSEEGKDAQMISAGARRRTDASSSHNASTVLVFLWPEE